MVEFSLSSTIQFCWLGKANHTDNWIHVTRKLIEFELIIVDSGTLYIADEYGQYEVHSGEYILMSPCEHQHGYRHAACSFYWMHFKYSDSGMNGNNINLPKHSVIPDFAKVLTLLSQIYYSKRFYSDIAQSSFLLISLLYELRNQINCSPEQQRLSSRKEGVSMQKEEICKNIKNYVYWNKTINIKVADIATHLNYSERYISSVFRSVTGKHLKTYITEEHIKIAQELLVDSAHTVTEIAYSLGYSDKHNFTRSFKRITGMSPTEFRNTYIKKEI